MRSHLRLPQIIWLLILAGLPIVGGCAHLATPAEKQSSFHPFVGARVGGESLGEFLEARTAIVIAGAEPILVKDHAEKLDLRLRSAGNNGIDIGSAAAISADGYFLTAAHCVTTGPLYLLYSFPGPPRIVHARLVWKFDDPADPFRDLAILKCDQPPESALAVADEFQFTVDSKVATNGVNGLAGGSILSINGAESNPRDPRVEVIVHDAPLAQGDSGGPLITLSGELIGVEVLARGMLLGRAQGIALRPDPKWLAAIIARDRARK